MARVREREATTARVRPAVGARVLLLLGPAFVAAIAYVDPGNVAANLTAGARYGYLLVWVLVAANAIAVFVQYQSAKLGIVTGRSLPELLGERLGTGTRRAYWVQAELVAAATDIAEVIGGAIALNLLFGLPLPIGGLVVGIVAIGILAIQSRRGQRPFEAVILGLLGVIAVGFLAGLFVSPVDWGAAVGGLVPRFDGAETVLLAAGMLGATVMPHAIYLHSALARDRHGPPGDPGRVRTLLHATRVDVALALVLAGAVNIAMLLVAASALGGVDGTDTIEGAYHAISSALGPAIGVIFAVGLLASGLASSSVGSYAGATIMGGLLKLRIPLLARRIATLVPAVVILALGADPTWALVLSQVFLSLGIPFAMIPLLRLTGSRAVMGESADRLWVRILGGAVAGLVVVLNLLLVGLTVAGA
ncbi:Nramp family divalent metal transporter [Leifsonia shinshuensis]|uniref:Nramp family divalent metal transporter n=1 Tax=Leifsonia shinshuensis TaxID=150026 RepID=UPI00285EC3AB|nr:Nramp family divalent metal transporter [Leifsonia shinshuensis]MDR6973067.1 manganese transport protein [Leifsonia shinshuensis]